MLEIEDIIKQSGLKKSFIYRCLREMPEVFESHIQTGSHNRKLFDQTALVIFDRIKQLKEKGLSVLAINEEIVKQLETPSKHLQNYSKTSLNENPEKHDNSFADRDKTVLELTEKLHQVEIEKIKAQNELEQIKSNLKLLPAGGDPNKARRLFALISTLEEVTKPKFLEGRKAKNLWKELREILYGSDGT